MFYLLVFFWFLRSLKAILFWLYLWQLKEYHIGRFWDHFKTFKGKKIFFNFVFIIKIILLFYAVALFFYPSSFPWYIYGSWIIILAVIYVAEILKALRDYFEGKLKKPVFSLKALFLFLANMIFIGAFISFLFYKAEMRLFYWFSLYLLLFDILTPLIVSAVSLILQPLTVIWRSRLIKKAKAKRDKFKDLLVIGITGSYGKTSTKDFLEKILSKKYKVLKTERNYNSEVGISRRILKDLNKDHQIFIVEMGAYNKGGIELLCRITSPKIGIVTGVNEQHLATFGSMENLLSAEGGKELIENLPKDGTVFLNANNKYCQELYSQIKIKKFLYGGEAKFLGGENILGAAAVARELSVGADEINKIVQGLANKIPGLEIKKITGELLVAKAVYSTNFDGIKAHLNYLKNNYPNNKKIIVMPCLIELGQASKEIHFKIGKEIARVCDLAVITTKDRFKEIKEGVTEEGTMKNENIIFSESPEEIFKKIKSFAREGDIILLEGRVPERLIFLFDF
jgi:UDP-N-acetylmuramoyl-tripeptide--D-alanyl-D-alanine ligase